MSDIILKLMNKNKIKILNQIKDLTSKCLNEQLEKANFRNAKSIKDKFLIYEDTMVYKIAEILDEQKIILIDSYKSEEEIPESQRKNIIALNIVMTQTKDGNLVYGYKAFINKNKKWFAYDSYADFNVYNEISGTFPIKIEEKEYPIYHYKFKKILYIPYRKSIIK